MAQLSPDTQDVWNTFERSLEALDGYEAPLAAAFRTAALYIGLTWDPAEIVAYLYRIANELDSKQ
jgi:hypothetical protein